MSKKKLLILFGKSSSGKSTVFNAICNELYCHKVVPVTNRPKRENEKNDIDYHFFQLHDDIFKKYDLFDFVEAHYFNKWFYGTPKEEIKENQLNICISNVYGIKQIIENYSNEIILNEIDILPVYIEADDRTRLLRSIDREYNNKNYNYKEICRRFLDDEEQFKNENLSFNYVTFLNDNYTYPTNILNIPRVKEFTLSYNKKNIKTFF